jgi:hypothetical protein|tara:strand:+ start:291 stop:560 length:270 start_codon:yes stop_codon:yes gene_type:complete
VPVPPDPDLQPVDGSQELAEIAAAKVPIQLGVGVEPFPLPTAQVVVKIVEVASWREQHGEAAINRSRTPIGDEVVRWMWSHQFNQDILG